MKVKVLEKMMTRDEVYDYLLKHPKYRLPDAYEFFEVRDVLNSNSYWYDIYIPYLSDDTPKYVGYEVFNYVKGITHMSKHMKFRVAVVKKSFYERFIKDIFRGK